MRPNAILVPLAATVIGVAACGSGGDQPASPTPADANPGGTAVVTTAATATAQRFPDVIGASAARVGDTWTISATVSSPYDSPARYADAWRVVGVDGTVYGERILLHDHANEQPFTRAQAGIEIPDDVATVVIEGRDLENGYGGGTFVLTLPD